MLKQLKETAMPAILLDKLEESTWFAALLRKAADNAQCPINDVSVPQKYFPARPENLPQCNWASLRLCQTIIPFPANVRRKGKNSTKIMLEYKCRDLR
jgi:hypothetical protein